jgi:hypothetical protein
MFSTWFLMSNCFEWMAIVNNMRPHPILKPRFLLSQKYAELYDKVVNVTIPELRLFWELTNPPDEYILRALANITKTETYQTTKTIAELLRRWCIASYLETGIVRGKVSCEAFQRVMKLDIWKEIWTIADHGRWVALMLKHFGIQEYVDSPIDEFFPSKVEGLQWIFLGAYGWFPRPYRDDMFADDATRTCCRRSANHEQDAYIVALLKTFNCQERTSIIAKAVRLAPE